MCMWGRSECPCEFWRLAYIESTGVKGRAGCGQALRMLAGTRIVMNLLILEFFVSQPIVGLTLCALIIREAATKPCSFRRIAKLT
jgi:hypothetical protein